MFSASLNRGYMACEGACEELHMKKGCHKGVSGGRRERWRRVVIGFMVLFQMDYGVFLTVVN